MQISQFSNFFLLTIVQAGTSINYLHTADAQSIYMASLISHCLNAGIETVEPTEQAENEWVDLCVSLSADRLAYFEKKHAKLLEFRRETPARVRSELALRRRAARQFRTAGRADRGGLQPFAGVRLSRKLRVRA